MTDAAIAALGPRAAYDQTYNFAEPGLQIELLHHVWAPCSQFVVGFDVAERYLTTLVAPREFIELRDHVSGLSLPIRARLENIPVIPDASWTALEGDEKPGAPGLWIEVEQWL